MKTDMEIFDELPPRVRGILRVTRFPYKACDVAFALAQYPEDLVVQQLFVHDHKRAIELPVAL